MARTLSTRIATAAALAFAALAIAVGAAQQSADQQSAAQQSAGLDAPAAAQAQQHPVSNLGLTSDPWD
ncbi:hypothetical protein [Actinokineospora diospyrosa]|uniref:Uncharacterized protein n=1 Tax=Actinokineospora diospyrosa TaxID=103728 RepID=A0ABT1IF38_9PSEU|nr:hypothetical protein [Actinokineospora diospyrosa]MCP2271161.1 hypothetical protein [Actinokineospora diospyrosa]